MKKNTYLAASLAVIIVPGLINSIAAQNRATDAHLNTTQSIQKKEMNCILKCRVSFKINTPTAVASLYFNFDHSTLEVISIKTISTNLNVADELSNRSSVENINKTGSIDLVLYKSSSYFPQDQSEEILEITFSSKTSKPDLASLVNLNNKFPRKTSLAYDGRETDAHRLEKELQIVSTDGRMIEKKTFQSFSSAKSNEADMTTFDIQLTILKNEDQFTTFPTETLAGPSFPSPNIKSLPNPFTSSTTVFYQLKQESTVQIELFNQYGLLTKRISSGRRPPGNHQITLSGQELPAGIYFCRLLADSNPLKTLKLIKL